MIYQKHFQVSGDYSLSGTAAYSFNSDSGLINYNFTAGATVVFFPVNLSQSGMVKVDPNLLLSSAITVGQKFIFGPVDVEVSSVDLKNKVAQAKVSVTDPSIAEVGTAHFDLSEQYAVLLGIETTGTAEGFSVAIQLVGI